jgi:hypothetical protein
MTEVANLEAAFERITVTDENDDQISSSTTYLKSKVCNLIRESMHSLLTCVSRRCPTPYH